MISHDLYTVVGVGRQATTEEIKRKFPKLLRTNHPDKGGDPDKFKQIREAQEKLCDAKKRKAYDDSLRPSQQASSRKRGAQWVHRIFHGKVSVSLKDLYLGETLKVPVKLTTSGPCPCCAPPPFALPPCPKCLASGVIVRRKKDVNEFVSSKQCTQCAGTGSNEPSCQTCGGSRSVRRTDTFEVGVEPGAMHGDLVDVEAPRGATFEVAVAPHDRFERIGDDLHVRTKIDLADALCGGFAVNLTHINGSTVHYPVAKGTVTPSGSSVVLPGLGMPLGVKRASANDEKRGALHVHFDVEFPSGPLDTNAVRQALKSQAPKSQAPKGR